LYIDWYILETVRILVGIALSVVAFGQQFDVVSVKPQRWTGQGLVGVLVRGDTLDAEHVSLKGLVLFAYNLREVQLSGGPGWAEVAGLLADSELFQVIAKISSDPPPPLDELALTWERHSQAPTRPVCGSSPSIGPGQESGGLPRARMP
jgi:hypothetical protein